MAPDFSPHFVEVSGRLVHYARAGAGPAVAMLHGSPQSHAALLRLGRFLAQRFTVLAFDTPGYGASEPLAPEASMNDFADALADTLRALGLGPVPVYGTHTGAAIALTAANRHPDLISRAVLDGFSLFTPAEQADLLARHLPPFRIEWDGSHMTRLWSRVRDQASFFPWYDRTARRPGDAPALAVQHQAVLNLLHAGPHYATAYAVSIALDPAALTIAPDRIRLFCRTNDVLIAHLDRLPAGFPPAYARAIAPGGDAAVAAALSEAPSCAAPAPVQPGRRQYVHGLHLRVLGDGPPLLLLHDLPGSSHTCLAAARVLAAGRTVIVPDLPGWGLSPAMPGQEDIRVVTRLVAAAAASFGAGPFEIAGVGLGGLLAPALARELPTPAIVQIEPVSPGPAFAAAYPVDVAPRWDGAHLVAAWFRQRDALLFRPWFDRRAASAIPLGTPDLAAVQDRATAMLEASGPDLTRTLLQQPAQPAGAPIGKVPSPAAAMTWLAQARSALPCA